MRHEPLNAFCPCGVCRAIANADPEWTLMLSRKPALILLRAASHTDGNENETFWLLYNLALSFSNGGVL